ncbi:MAG: hypothetical protein ACT6R2_13675, partial [Blastomonas fulva]|uniref:hypothetical protein n=1 Tax=Blastomonas fulva TaxID=1550728 RepID=UPI004033C251
MAAWGGQGCRPSGALPVSPLIGINEARSLFVVMRCEQAENASCLRSVAQGICLEEPALFETFIYQQRGKIGVRVGLKAEQRLIWIADKAKQG